jgi:hypothetical protein
MMRGYVFMSATLFASPTDPDANRKKEKWGLFIDNLTTV